MAENQENHPFGADYFQHGCGRPYERDEEWLRFFEGIAKRIVADINPRTALDAGCAMGFLVEGLRKYGVESYGIDISEYAIEKVHPSIKDFCWRGSITDPLPQRYDLIICIEVLEHLKPSQTETAIEILCHHADDLLFSSTPFDYKEVTHFNVRPPEYWAELFAKQGYFRDVDFDASFITPWAVRYQKSEEPVHRLIRRYEKGFAWLWKETVDLRTLAAEMRTQLSESERIIQSSQASVEEKDQILQEQAAREREQVDTTEALRRDLRNRGSEIERLSLDLATERQSLLGLKGELADAEDSVRILRLELDRLKTVSEAKAQHATTQLIVLQEKVGSRDARNADLEREVKEQAALLHTVAGSKSWRMTEPLRQLMLHLREARRRLLGMAPSEPPEQTGAPGASVPGPDLLVRLKRMLPRGLNSPRSTPPASGEAARAGVPSANQSGSLSVAEIVDNRFAHLRPLRAFSVARLPHRINLVTDSINGGSLFGGVGTAIVLSALLAESRNASLRIITRTEKARESNFQHVLVNNGIEWSQNVTFAFSDLGNLQAEIDVGEGDLFLTTSWWTTWAVAQSLGTRRIVYLLQEDERMFYPYGDDYLRCNQILRNEELLVVVNTQMLFDSLVSEGFHHLKRTATWFEPAFYAGTFYPAEKPAGSKRSFLFYARPNNLRNLYFLGLEVINEAVYRRILDPNYWKIYFVGKDLSHLVLGSEVNPILQENLTWSEYGELVRTIDLGLTLMYTPHPSYPPLDLAASGSVVVTNKFRGKQNLDKYSRNILCFDADVESLVGGIAEGIKLCEDEETRERNYLENGLLRDWNMALEPTIKHLNGHLPNVSR